VFATQREKKAEPQFSEGKLRRQNDQLKVENEFRRKKYECYLLKAGKSD